MPPRVAMIMPVYNEARHLRAVLDSIASQSFDCERLFFIAVDGGSTDGSVDILRSWFTQSGIAGCVISNPRRKIPIALNLGLELTTNDDIILRLDAHTLYGATYVADAVRGLESAPPDVCCVGCAQIPEPSSRFKERVVGALYTNPMGLGGADFRVGDDVREVDNIYLGVWRPGVMSRTGGFNETMEANEDGEMSARLRQMGYRILRIPLPCRCLIKRGMTGTIRQWGRYGYWRSKMLQRNPQCIRRRHVIPPAAAILVLVLASSPLRLILLPAFSIYALLVFRCRADAEPLPVTLSTLAFFPLVQFAFGCGMLIGLLTGRGAYWPPDASTASAQINS